MEKIATRWIFFHKFLILADKSTNAFSDQQKTAVRPNIERDSIARIATPRIVASLCRCAKKRSKKEY
jgi:hypothetical protein